MSRWSYGARVATVRLPFGAETVVVDGAEVRAGDPLARGTHYRATRRIHAAKALACAPDAVRGLLRVAVGERVRAGAILARAGRRFPRAIVAAEDARVVHLGVDGVLHLGSVSGEWLARAPLDGVVRHADADRVDVAGECWSLDAFAAFGPTRAGLLEIAVPDPAADLAPARLDAALAGRLLVGGARASGEALTRAHAVGAAGIVAAAASFRALEPVYGETVSAFGAPMYEDAPTLLVLAGFGRAPFDRELFERLVALAGERAAIDSRSATLHVFAPPNASRALELAPLALDEDLGGVR